MGPRPSLMRRAIRSPAGEIAIDCRVITRYDGHTPSGVRMRRRTVRVEAVEVLPGHAHAANPAHPAPARTPPASQGRKPRRETAGGVAGLLAWIQANSSRRS